MVNDLDLRKFQKHVKTKSPAFVPLFKNKSRYQVAWGGAGSGKSHIVARKIIYRILQEENVKHNFLIIRKVDRTIEKSCWTLVNNIVNLWGLGEDVEKNKTTKTIKFKNGSQIMFSGLDDPEKLKSIEGVTSIWVEESTELNQQDFEQLDLRLRGEHGCVKQIILTLNPISEKHWIKRVFFDDPIDSVFTLHTTYLDNAFIDDEYKMVIENKKKSNPRYYQIYGLGMWGVAEGLIFSNIEHRVIKEHEFFGLPCIQGLDFGYTNHPTAFHTSYIDTENNVIYVYDGFYDKGLSNEKIATKIKEMLCHKTKTTADSAEPKSIERLKSLGCKVEPAKKGKDSVRTGVDFLLDYKIVVNAHLLDFKGEFDLYSWQEKNGEKLDMPVDDYNHFIDSLRYSCEKYMVKRGNIYDAIRKKKKTARENRQAY